jgi:hypothetical protein
MDLIMKNAVLCDLTPCGSCFGGTYHLHHQGVDNQRARNPSLSSLILFTLLIEVISSSDTPVITRATRRHLTYSLVQLSLLKKGSGPVG